MHTLIYNSDFFLLQTLLVRANFLWKCFDLLDFDTTALWAWERFHTITHTLHTIDYLVHVLTRAFMRCMDEKNTFQRITIRSFWPFFNFMVHFCSFSVPKAFEQDYLCLLIWLTQIRQHIHTWKPFQPWGLSFLNGSLLFSNFCNSSKAKQSTFP